MLYVEDVVGEVPVCFGDVPSDGNSSMFARLNTGGGVLLDSRSSRS